MATEDQFIVCSFLKFFILLVVCHRCLILGRILDHNRIKKLDRVAMEAEFVVPCFYMGKSVVALILPCEGAIHRRLKSSHLTYLRASSR